MRKVKDADNNLRFIPVFFFFFFTLPNSIKKKAQMPSKYIEFTHK